MDDTRQDIHTNGIPQVCQSCEARHRGICGAMTERQLLALSQTTNIKPLPAGTELVGMGEEATIYANVLKGVVKLSKLMADGRQQLVGLQFAPDFVGRPFSETSNVSAEAATDIEVCTFPKQSLLRLMAESPELENKLYRQALDELDEARDWMLTLGRRTSEEKLASFLYTIALHSDPTAALDDDSEVEIEIPITRADIADFLGLTIETISRQFTRLRSQGIIVKLDGRKVRIPKLSALREIAAC